MKLQNLFFDQQMVAIHKYTIPDYIVKYLHYLPQPAVCRDYRVESVNVNQKLGYMLSNLLKNLK